MKRHSYLILFTCLFSLSCDKECKNGHQSIFFANHSNKSIEIVSTTFPDTLITTANPFEDNIPTIKPNEIYEDRLSSPRKSCIEKEYSNDFAIWVYFFDLDSINKLTWDTIRTTKRGLLDRRKIDLNYLKQNNFNISYP